MQKIIYNNEIYYYHNNAFYDSHFLRLDKITMKPIAQYFFNNIDYKKFDQNELIEFISKIKDSELYQLTFDICNYGFLKFNNSSFIRRVLPIIMSSFRNMNRPLEAINIALNHINNHSVYSLALFTSLAAAYCDIKDYSNAKKYINKAYALQGGGKNETNEISLVYKRINAETGGCS